MSRLYFCKKGRVEIERLPTEIYPVVVVVVKMDAYYETMDKIGDAILNWADPDKVALGYTEVRFFVCFSEKKNKKKKDSLSHILIINT